MNPIISYFRLSSSLQQPYKAFAKDIQFYPFHHSPRHFSTLHSKPKFNANYDKAQNNNKVKNLSAEDIELASLERDVILNKFHQVEKRWETISQWKTIQLKTFKLMAQFYLLHGEIERLEKLIEEMRVKNLQPDMELYNTLLEGYSKTKQLDKMLVIIEEIKARSFQPNSSVFNSLILAYSKLNDTENIMKTFLSMKNDFHCSPNNDTFLLLFQHFQQKNDENINQLLYKMIQENSGSLSTAEVNLYIELLLLRDEPQDLQLAIKCFDTATSLKLANDKTKLLGIELFSRIDDFDKAIEMVKQLHQKNIDLGAETMKKLVIGLAKAGKADYVIEVARMMGSNLNFNDNYWRNVMAHLSQYSADKLESFLAFAGKSGMASQPHTFHFLIQSWIKNNTFDKAISFYHSMKRNAPEQISKMTYYHMLEGSRICKNQELFGEILEDLRKNKVKSTDLLASSILQGYLSFGLLKEAVQFYFTLNKQRQWLNWDVVVNICNQIESLVSNDHRAESSFLESLTQLRKITEDTKAFTIDQLSELDRLFNLIASVNNSSK